MEKKIEKTNTKENNITARPCSTCQNNRPGPGAEFLCYTCKDYSNYEPRNPHSK